jgi:hypothetical protein
VIKATPSEDTVEWEGDRDGTDGTSGLVRGPESGTLAAVETGPVIERDRVGPWASTLDRFMACSSSNGGFIPSMRQAITPRALMLSGTGGNFSGTGNDGTFHPADRGQARSRTLHHQP